MKAIAYYRVSTKKQGVSRLGLEAQQHSVEQYLRYSAYEVVHAYTEVESGRKVKRVQLLAALAKCKELGATLIIAKVDRLARNVHFVSGLMEAKVKFVCVDMPEANELILHIMAAFAQHEAGIISTRTKDALARAKANGKVLGNKKAKRQGLNRALGYRDRIEQLQRGGVNTVRGLAARCGLAVTVMQRLLTRLRHNSDE